VFLLFTAVSLTFENYIAVTLGVGKVGKLFTSLIEKVVNPSIYSLERMFNSCQNKVWVDLTKFPHVNV
jgi:hypothetical protein